MEELIKINANDAGIRSVSARDLHEFLQSKQDFSTWIKAKIKKYGFVENQDYTSFHKIVERTKGGTILIEYDLTMDMAKELAMVEANDRGRQARQYFIECERIAKQQHRYNETVSLSNSISYNVCVILNQIVIERGKLQLQIDKKKKELSELNYKLGKLDYEKSRFEEVLQVSGENKQIDSSTSVPQSWITIFKQEYGGSIFAYIEKHIGDWTKEKIIPISDFNRRYSINFIKKTVYLNAISDYCKGRKINFVKNRQLTFNGKSCHCRIFESQ